MSPSAPFAHELRVRYGECDPQGIVFNANYLLYADVAFTEFWREAVGPWQEMVDRGCDAVVGEASLRFRAPARFDDLLSLCVAPRVLGATSLTTAVSVVRGENLLVEIELRHVCIELERYGKQPWPEWVRGPLALALEGDRRA